VELQEILTSSFVLKMVQVEELLEILNTLILSFVDNTITIDKITLQSIVTCLHVLQAKTSLLQNQNRLLHDALKRQNLQQHFEPILIQSPLFKNEEDVEDDSDQQPVHEQLSEIVPDSSTNQLPLSKQIIKHWEEIRQNKHRMGIGYENDVTFHNPYYTKPIQLQSVGLFQDNSHSPALVQE
jgi:hypothetical protein